MQTTVREKEKHKIFQIAPSFNLSLKEKIIEQISYEQPKISIIVLNWNREHLLRTTVLSLIATVRFPFELFIVDNASTDGSKKWISLLSQRYEFVKPVLLDKNIGGEAINKATKLCKGDFIFISENDFEYLPDWDINMLIPFYAFPDLGQLSPCSPYPQKEIGEIWKQKPYVVRTIGDVKNYLAKNNIGTSCMVRRELIDNGLKWESVVSADGKLRFPADGKFSDDVKKTGYTVAWSEKYNVINWGHIASTWEDHPEYFIKNWETKAEHSIDGLKKNINKTSADTSKDEEIRRLKLEVGRLQQELHGIQHHMAVKIKFFIIRIVPFWLKRIILAVLPQGIVSILRKLK